MTLVGCDLHTRKQQVAVLHTDTGEVEERELLHSDNAVEQFYGALPRPVTVGIESTGYALWFHELMQRLGHTLLVGEAAKIRAMVVRKTKTDRRDAQHLLDLLKHERFPTRVTSGRSPNRAARCSGGSSAKPPRWPPAPMTTSTGSIAPCSIAAGAPRPAWPSRRKLLVRLFIMVRDQIDYAEFRRRGRSPRADLHPSPA